MPHCFELFGSSNLTLHLCPVYTILDYCPTESWSNPKGSLPFRAISGSIPFSVRANTPAPEVPQLPLLRSLCDAAVFSCFFHNWRQNRNRSLQAYAVLLNRMENIFTRTESEIELLSERTTKFAPNRIFQGMDWEGVKTKYERIRSMFVENDIQSPTLTRYFVNLRLLWQVPS